MSKQLRVLQLGDRVDGAAGGARDAGRTGVALAGIGYPVVVATPADAGTREACEGVGVSWHNVPLRSVVDLASMRRLGRLVRALKTPLVHVYGPIAHAVALGALALGGEFRLLVSRSRTFPVRHVVRPLLRTKRVARIVATCEAVRQVVIRTAAVSPQKVDLVGPGVDTARFDPRRTRPAAVRQQLGVPPHGRIVAHVGMQDWRGWRELLAAFPSIRSACPEAHLLLLGCRRPAQRDWVVGLAHEMGLADAVTVALFREDMADVLACAELFVDASWAGTGIARSLCEAMVLGRPVVATTWGGSPEIITDGRTGLLVPPRDTATLIAAVVRLLRDVELASALAAAGQAHAAASLAIEVRARRLASIYGSLSADPGAPVR